MKRHKDSRRPRSQRGRTAKACASAETMVKKGFPCSTVQPSAQTAQAARTIAAVTAFAEHVDRVIEVTIIRHDTREVALETQHLILSYSRQAFALRHSNPTHCLCCKHEFADLGPQTFVVTMPFGDAKRGLVSGVCDECSKQTNTELMEANYRW